MPPPSRIRASSPPLIEESRIPEQAPELSDDRDVPLNTVALIPVSFVVSYDLARPNKDGSDACQVHETGGVKAFVLCATGGGPRMREESGVSYPLAERK